MLAPPDSANTANLAVFAESGGATCGHEVNAAIFCIRHALIGAHVRTAFHFEGDS